MIVGLSRRQGAAFAAACASRVFDVLLDYERAPKSAAREAVAVMWRFVETGELDASAVAELRGRLIRDGELVVVELELPPTHALRTVLSALLAAADGDPIHVEQAALAALDTAGSADRDNAEEAVREEESWQDAALAMLAQSSETPAQDSLVALREAPPRWLLRFEGNA